MATYPELNGKTVVITGGSRGIGAQTAHAFVAQGAQVCVVGRDEQALADVVARITESGGIAISETADVTDAAALEHLRRQTESRLGPVDVPAAFAGGQGFPVPTAELSKQRWRQVIDADLTSTFLTIQAFLPRMLERAGRAASSPCPRPPGASPARPTSPTASRTPAW
ncbi:SDR family NAD(P)-dependent oxidoreductase [Saccharopolyspora shandongensis]|uniref:SDR family NAD(P)-dependent oxidoreductase n=1 Tax=Saccharopolyspora shandongensis TaxID=418495 RepID=UPI0033F5D7B2